MNMDRTALSLSDTYLQHDTGMHPENARRYTAITEYLEMHGYFPERKLLTPVPADPASLSTFHDEVYVSRIQNIAESGGGSLDPDTVISQGSWDAALTAIGASQQAVDSIVSRTIDRAFVVSRPPGHHAESGRGLGFCLFNNVAAAARQALDAHGMDRVVIIDWDVHHGNGTQEIFYSSENVFYISLHQWPLFPGTGRANERGEGYGEGYTLNIPVEPFTTDERYRQVFDDVIALAIRDYHPDMIFVSAGYDAHRDDPLATVSLTTDAFSHMSSRVRELADELCNGRLLLILEGGYNLTVLGKCVGVTIDSVDGISR